MISEKSIFTNSIESYADKFYKTNYEKINSFISSSALRAEEGGFIFEQNVFVPEPKKTAVNLANEIWEQFKKPTYVRSFISKQVYALYCEGNLLYKFWLRPLPSFLQSKNEIIVILTELYDPMISEERYNELILKIKNEHSFKSCIFKDGKFKTHKLKLPGLQIYVTGKIVITDNLQNIMFWAQKNKIHLKHEVGPFMNDTFLERLIIQDVIIYNAAEYSIIPYFEIGKKKIASLWVSLKFQLLSVLLRKTEGFTAERNIKNEKEFDPFEITSETCIFGTKLAGKIKEKKNKEEFEYKPHLIAQSKGQIKYFM